MPVFQRKIVQLDALSEDFAASGDTFNLGDCVQWDWHRWYEALYAGLEHTAFAYTLADSSLAVEELARFKVVIMPAFAFLDRETSRKLLAYVEQGGRLLIGPRG